MTDWAPDGQALRAWRTAQRPRWWDRETLAREAGVALHTIARLERGANVEFVTRARLAAFTGLTDALLSPNEREAAGAALDAGRE